jgi:hypothetical protein
VKDYERFWSERFDRLDVVLERLQVEEGDVAWRVAGRRR